ncbi:MAG: citrate (Si)-synthase [Chloroflexi bacterium]|nr:citrate (Si)-synthase [Chloroflexota bacterium]
MTTQQREISLARGLKGVYLDTTESSDVQGDIGKLIYRGYNIHDLAEQSTFEETIYLLLYGKLPTRAQLNQFGATLHQSGKVPGPVIDIIRSVQKSHPMDVLRTAVSALSAFDPETEDNSPEATLRKGIRLTAQTPTIVCAHDRIRHGLKPVEPNPSLNFAANFLYMLKGEAPSEADTKLMDTDFILHADHGSNASAFGARVAASTLADLHCAVVAGVATLKGPWHGGAAEKVMEMALEIGEESKALSYIEDRLKKGDRVMGFGHRVYTAEDPRARHLRDRAKALGDRMGQPKWWRILSAVEERMRPYARRGICVNVDFWSGSIYYLLGIPEDLFISIFAIGRVPGWAVQVLEQQKNNILIRPLLKYVGPMDVPYVPIDQRS